MSRAGKRAARPRPPRAETGRAPGADRARPLDAARWAGWIAAALIVLFGVYWAAQAFTFHRIGNYGVETDFYWKYGPAARGLAEARVQIEHYDSKGWGYPAAVAFLSILGFETFRAGQVIALLSAVLVLFLVYRLHRALFGPIAALAALALVAGNATFLANTYEVGTDLFFLAVALGSVALLLGAERPGWRALLASGLLGGWAFATRYNGLFLLGGALATFLLLRWPEGPIRAQWRRAGLWTAGLLIGALPWLWINAAHTGNPLTNTNYVNVGYAVYGEGNWEKFFYGADRKIGSLADVVLLDPGRFVAAMARNVVEHLRRDLTELLALPWGLLAALGALLLATGDRPGRRIVAYFVFGALGFLSMVPVFYGTRFSLAILPFYAALATWPLVSPRLARMVAGAERSVPARAIVYLVVAVPIAIASYRWTDDPRNPESLRAGPYELSQAVDYLSTAGRGEALLARKPHAAFLARMRFVPIPEVPSLDSLRAVAARERARFLLLSGAEYRFRPALHPLAEETVTQPGYRRVFESQGALVYEIEPPERPVKP